MTFGIKSTESLPEGLSREIRQQVLAAEEALSEPEDVGLAAHETRKTLKRARALVKLTRPSLTPDAYRGGNRTMRDAGRCVSPVRDADVTAQTARSVHEGAQGTGLERPWGELAEAFSIERDSLFATATGSDGPFAETSELLGSLDGGWPEVGEIDDRELLRLGLGDS